MQKEGRKKYTDSTNKKSEDDVPTTIGEIELLLSFEKNKVVQNLKVFLSRLFNFNNGTLK